MKEKRVINILKNDFNKIKEYCDKNTLQMTKWITKIALEKIEESRMFRKIIFSRITNGDFFTAMCFTKNDKQINIKFDGFLHNKISLNDTDLIKCMAFEAYKHEIDFYIDEKTYTDEWKNFEINKDCIIENNDDNGGINV